VWSRLKDKKIIYEETIHPVSMNRGDVNPPMFFTDAKKSASTTTVNWFFAASYCVVLVIFLYPFHEALRYTLVDGITLADANGFLSHYTSYSGRYWAFVDFASVVLGCAATAMLFFLLCVIGASKCARFVKGKL
jgi:hypothetical protein